MNQKHYFQDLNKIVDSHCHLDFQDFDKDRDKIINNAKISNVDYFLTISVNLEDFDKVYEVTQNYENIWCTTGIHPNHVDLKINSVQFENIKRNIIKEIGFMTEHPNWGQYKGIYQDWDYCKRFSKKY